MPVGGVCCTAERGRAALDWRWPRLLLLLSALVTEAASAAPAKAGVRPEFLSRPTVLTVRAADAVVLPCRTRHTGDISVVWQQGTNVLTARHLIVDSDTRLSLVDGHDLRIADVVRTDAGNYTCAVSSKPRIELTHTLEVLYEPVVSTKPASGQLVARQGDNVTLECSADGNPAADLSWNKQRGTLPSSRDSSPGPLLRLDSLSREMAGVYQCTAENGIGEPGIATVSLHVEYPPEVKVERSTIYTGEHREVRMVCLVFADPPATVSWDRQGSSSSFDPERHFTPENDGGTRHPLIIQDVRSQDFGYYSCQAKNALGTASAQMSVTGVPDRAVVTSGAISAAPQLYELSWEVRSFSPVLEYKVVYRPAKDTRGGRNTRWKEVKVPPTASQTSSEVLYRQKIPLSGLQPATAYDLFVQAKNKHGWSAVSETLRFTTIAKGEALESRSLSSSTPSLRPRLASCFTFCVALLSSVLSLLLC